MKTKTKKRPGKKAKLSALVRSILAPHYEDFGVRVLELKGICCTIRVTSEHWADMSTFGRIKEIVDLTSKNQEFRNYLPTWHTVTKEQAKSFIPKRDLKKWKYRQGCICRDCVLY